MDLLIVDDDDAFRSTLVRRLSRREHSVREAATGEEALRLAAQEKFDVAVIDLHLPKMDGIELLAKLKQLDPHCQVILLTGEGSIETAVSAMKRGAYDYLTKPCVFSELEVLLTKAYECARLERENVQLRAALRHAAPSSEIVGQSQAIQKVLRLIGKAGPSESPVLIEGESGTGKELVARALHQFSPRSDKPMVAINCAALPEALLESELFGHEKGAFTGAVAAKMGLFEVADGGTLFIDELGELAGALQAKLLRVLQDGNIRRVGATKEIQVDARVVAATNRKLADEVKAGRFRDDLYYRLNVITVVIPPLRERRDDIPLLIDHFLRRPVPAGWQLTGAAHRALGNYSWPGNIRELANVIERAKILADDKLIDLEHLPEAILDPAEAMQASAEPVTPAATDDLSLLERERVASVLKREEGNKARAAKALGISRRSLYRLIEKYAIDASDQRNPNQ